MDILNKSDAPKGGTPLPPAKPAPKATIAPADVKAKAALDLDYAIETHQKKIEWLKGEIETTHSLLDKLTMQKYWAAKGQ